MFTGLGLGVAASSHKFAAVAGRDAVSVTALNGASISTAQSKFGGASGEFDGSNDYLDVASGQGIDDSATDFTWEGWYRFDINPENQTIGGGSYMMAMSIVSNTYLMIQEVGGQRTLQVADSGTFMNFVESGGSGWNTNQWYHLAWVRENNQYDCYIDGVALPRPATSTKSGGFINDLGFRIGRFNDFRGSMDGYMDEIRISNTARYTTNFTPPTAPFQNDENTLLLLHMDGTDGSTTFEDDNGVRTKVGASAFGNAQIKTARSKFGGASAFIDTTDDYIAIDGANFDFSGDYTIEFWVNINILVGGAQRIFTMFDGTTLRFLSSISSSNNNGFVAYYPGFVVLNSNSGFRHDELNTNEWYHYALVKDGSAYYLYINGGEQEARVGSPNENVTDIYIGDAIAPSSNPESYIDELRISNVARYPGGTTFTPPTAPFQNDDNTLLLLHMDGTDGSTAFEDDNS